MLEHQRVVEHIPFALELVHMGMVVGVIETDLAGLTEAFAHHLPACRIKRRFCRHIDHAAAARCRTVIIPLFTVIVPVAAIGIHISSVDIVQLTCLKGIGRGYLLELAVK